MKTYDTKRTDRQKKEAQERMMPSPMMPGYGGMAGDEEYPYGLHVTLDGDTMKTLGINKMPAKDSKYRIEGGAKVVSTSSDSDEGDRLRLVLHQLGMEPVDEPEPEKSIRDTLQDAKAGRIGARGGEKKSA